MMEKNLILADLQKQLKEANNDETKILINELIWKITSGSYNVRVW